MTESFIISCRLKFAYRTNNIIHSIKGIPGLKNLLPDSLYSNKALLTVVNVFSVIYEFLRIFGGKLFYVLCFLVLPVELYEVSKDGAFINVFFFLTLVGTFLNTSMFSPSKDKYYAMFVMRMDAREYTLSNYFYFLLKSGIGILPFTLIFGLSYNVNIAVCLLMPVFLVAIKSIVGAVMLKYSFYTKDFKNKAAIKALSYSLILLLLAAAFVPPVFHLSVGMWFFIAATAVSAVASIFAFKYLLTYDGYKYVYKTLFADNSYLVDGTSSAGQVMQTSFLKKVDTDVTITSNKKGCAYLNDIFVKRHRKILTDSAKIFAIAELAIIVLGAFAANIFPTVGKSINHGILNYFPFALFVMYFINRGTQVTRAMFMNCDHSLLAYRFFRKPDIVLKLFTARLKSLVFINFIPASVLIIGVPLLVYLSGGTTDPLNYVLIAATIIMMSVFFSIHNLVLYYLLQPYNINFQTKSALYKIIEIVTYYICFIAAGKQIPLFIFGVSVSAFCLLYVIIALILVYRLAPKTFKLRQ